MLHLAVAAPSVDGVRASTGSLAERIAPTDDATLVVHYTSEQAGKLGTCGCAQRPRGGIGRLHSYLLAARSAQPDTPQLLVHAGRWASDRMDATGDLRGDARIANQAMLHALDLVDISAANITWRDGPTFSTSNPPDWAISATLGPPTQSSARIHTAGDLRIAIIGASPSLAQWMQPDGWQGLDPVVAVGQAVTAVVDEVDLIIVLAFGTGRDTETLARIPGVDVLVEAGDFTGREAPWTDEDTVWVRSRSQGQSVGELRLWLDEEGRITTAIDRWIDLDDRIPEHRMQRRVARRAEREQTAWLRDNLDSR